MVYTIPDKRYSLFLDTWQGTGLTTVVARMESNITIGRPSDEHINTSHGGTYIEMLVNYSDDF